METREVAGERGFYAKQTLSEGTLVLAEQPHCFAGDEDDFAGLLSAHVLGRGLLDRATGLRPTPAAAGAAPALSKNATEAAAWLARVEGVSAAAAADAYEAGENNGFVTTLRGQPTSILFEKLARFNHSCWPNCGLSREEATGMTRVYTVAAVPADAELKISYSDEFVLYPTQFRRAFLKALFGFECSCQRCAGIEDESGEWLVSLVDALLEEPKEAPSIGSAQANARLASAQVDARRAHASLFSLKKTLLPSGVSAVSGFAIKEQPSWQHAHRAAESALEALRAAWAPTHWMVVSTEALYVRALEELALVPGATAAAVQAALEALLEHADVMVKLYHPHVSAVIELASRVDALLALLGEAGSKGAKAVAKVRKARAKALGRLQQQKDVVAGWLEQGRLALEK